MKKLEFKDIVGYLPHKLKCLVPDYFGPQTLEGLINEEALFPEYRFFDPIFIKHIKPVLQPLSNLVKEIEHGGEEFVPAKRLAEIAIEKGYYKPTYANSVDECSYKIVQKPFGKILKITDFEQWVLIVSLSDMGRNKSWVMDLLHEWHFDVHGLIEEGLAVDGGSLGKDQ